MKDIQAQVAAIINLLRVFRVDVDDDILTVLTLAPVLSRLYKMDRDAALELLADPEFAALLDRYDPPSEG